MRAVLVSLAMSLSLALAACSDATMTEEGMDGAVATAPAGNSYAESAPADADQRAGGQPMADAAAPPAPAQQPSEQGGEQPAPQAPAPVRYLAYSYFVGIEAPADRVDSLMQAHIAACTQAGVRVCQVIQSNREGDPQDWVRGQFHLRAEPRWLAQFRAQLDDDAESAGGRIRQETTNTEDLTRAIVDTEARLRASRALRDRLQRLLESRPGRLQDLLEVERELARVQGEIDSIESNLAVMRTRVEMSELTLDYTSRARAVGSNTFEPLGDAFANFLSLVVRGFAGIVTFIAVILPGAIVIGLIAWLVLAIRRRRGGVLWRRTPHAPPPDANV